MPPDEAERVASLFTAIAAKRESFRDLPNTNLHKDGHLVHLETSGVPIFDSAGAYRGYRGTERDITARRQAEASLRFTQFSVDHASDAIYWTDPDGHFVRVSDSACRLFGYSEEELLSMSVLDLDPSLSAEQRAANSERLRKANVLTFETIGRTKSGDIFPIEVTVNRVDYEGIAYNCVFAHDITSRKQIERERLELERQLQHAQKLESLGVLAGGIAHDFNNILTSVLGNAELALAELSPSSLARENVLEIAQASHRAAALCRQMLAYSGRGKFVSEPIDLSVFIENLLPLLKSSISKKALLDLQLEKNLPLLEGDPSQLGQVVMNLVLNASEALGEEDGAITIRTGAREWSREYLRE